jgi:AAHS family 4-hydroxybenzoate transporter-like MFS transporter
MTAEAAPATDLGRALDQGPWTGFQKWVLVLAALAFAVDGLANQVLGIAIPGLIREWKSAPDAFAPVAAAGLIGVALGASIGGVLGDRFGRRTGLIGAILLFGAATACCALAKDPGQLMALRFVDGLGIGGAIPNGAALISEFTPFRRRTWAVSLSMVFIPVGGVLAGLAGKLLLAGLGWKAVFLVGGAASFVVAVLFLLVLPESPRFLLGRPARRGELDRLLVRCGVPAIAGPVPADSVAEKPRAPIRTLLSGALLPDTLAIWAAFFFCLLASYTMFSWIPTMLAGQGFDLKAASTGSLVFNIGGVVGGVAGGWLIQISGSKLSVPLMSVGGVIGALVLGMSRFDPAQGMLAIGLALFAEGVFVAGLHNGMYTLAAYVYPPSARATGVGAAAAFGRIGAVISSYTGAYSLKLAGASGYFVLVAGAIAISLISIALVRNHIPAAARAPAPA